MERKKNLLIIMLNVLALCGFAQNNEAFYKAYIEGDMKQWKQIMDSFEAKSPALQLELLNYQYGYIAFCLAQKDNQQAETYLKQAEKNVAALQRRNYLKSMLYAYESAFAGFRIGLAPHKAPFIGRQSIDFAQKAITLDSANYFAYIQLGNISVYKPAVLGGSKLIGMQNYLKALELMESNPKLLKNNWNYLNLLVAIIEVYIDEKQFAVAEKYCLKALAFEADFKWVKNELYPYVKNKSHG